MINKTIIFPNLHITLHNVSDTVSLFGHDFSFYGIIIACAMLVGVCLSSREAIRLGVDKDAYLDVCIATIIFGVLGARAYYVIFSWDYYSKYPLDILKIWEGGLGIYGGILVGALTVFITCKIRKQSFLKVADAAIFAVLIGQIAGRWGNFFNREAFGKYCDGLFAMQLPICDVRSTGDLTQEMYNHAIAIDGYTFVSVTPTFLYESSLNLLLLIFLLIYKKHKKFDGELFLMYFAGYGTIRFFVEPLRTDQLLLWNTNIPISQLIALILVVISVTCWVRKKVKLSRENA